MLLLSLLHVAVSVDAVVAVAGAFVVAAPVVASVVAVVVVSAASFYDDADARAYFKTLLV